MKELTLAVPQSLMIRSETIASTSADSTIEGRYSSSTSGGHKTTRRATPSSSISAAAAISWSVVAMRTEQPLSSWDRPPRKEPANKSRRRRLVSVLEIKGSHVSTEMLTASHREAGLLRNILIKPHEIAERNRKRHILRKRKRIESKGVFKPAY